MAKKLRFGFILEEIKIFHFTIQLADEMSVGVELVELIWFCQVWFG